MRGPHNVWRLVRTGATLERTGAMKIVLDAYEAPPLLRLGARVVGWPLQWLGHTGDPAMPPATRALTTLGPAYIKFGQILSTRPDLVGNDLALQLRVLQDQLPAFPTEVAKATIQEELGLPVDSIFDDFSEPVAAASIAQVHRARLRDTGEDVAVKVLRPGIEKAFRKDIDAFYFAASFIELLSPASRRLHPSDVVAHFEGVVQGELDLRLEAASASTFASNTSGDAGFRLPAVKWQESGRRVMTMSWVEGVSLGDNDALDAAGHDRRALGERVLTLFLNHALRDGYFHADMHQGNLKVGPDGAIVAYDFGIMGHIDEYTRRVYGAAALLSVRRDRTFRDGDAHRVDPAATHDGGGRRCGTLSFAADQYLGSRQPGGRGLHPPQPWPARIDARPGPHRRSAGAVRPAPAATGGACIDATDERSRYPTAAPAALAMAGGRCCAGRCGRFADYACAELRADSAALKSCHIPVSSGLRPVSAHHRA